MIKVKDSDSLKNASNLYVANTNGTGVDRINNIYVFGNNIVQFNETRITSSTWGSADKTKGFELVSEIYGRPKGGTIGTDSNCWGIFVPCTKGNSVSFNFFDFMPTDGKQVYCEVDGSRRILTVPTYYINSGSWITHTLTATNNSAIGFVIQFHNGTSRLYAEENYTVFSGTEVPTSYDPYGLSCIYSAN